MSNGNKPHISEIIFKSIKTLILFAALFIAYLFAINGRYHVHGEGMYFDKWTKTIIFVDRIKEIK